MPEYIKATDDEEAGAADESKEDIEEVSAGGPDYDYLLGNFVILR